MCSQLVLITCLNNSFLTHFGPNLVAHSNSAVTHQWAMAHRSRLRTLLQRKSRDILKTTSRRLAYKEGDIECNALRPIYTEDKPGVDRRSLCFIASRNSAPCMARHGSYWRQSNKQGIMPDTPGSSSDRP